jgi:hypothetical protein
MVKISSIFPYSNIIFVLPSIAAANEASATPGMMLGVVCHPMAIAVKGYRLVVCTM